jgi:ribosomal protein S18 acetylase RimI-like enzyme
MQLELRRATNDDLTAIVDLSLLAWAPVFASLRQTFSPGVFGLLYPDWQQQQREVVERICTAEQTTVWVAEAGGTIAGFVTYILDQGERIGTVELLAVHPDHQQQGVATALNRVALDQMKSSGMKLAGLSTGGDPGHAPARRAYERAGYVAFPNVWYYQEL